MTPINGFADTLSTTATIALSSSRTNKMVEQRYDILSLVLCRLRVILQQAREQTREKERERERERERQREREREIERETERDREKQRENIELYLNTGFYQFTLVFIKAV